MSSQQEHPLIQPLLDRLADQGAALTDKALQSLNLAAYDAKDYQYRELYDDSLFTGVLRSHGAVTGLFQSLGVNPLEIIDRVHAPLRPSQEYRRTYARTRERQKRKRRHERPIRAEGIPLLRGLHGDVTSQDLFLNALKMPAVWQAVHDLGLSVNKVQSYAKHLQVIEPDIETQKFVIGLDGGRFTFDLFDFAAGIKLHGTTAAGELIIPARVNFVTPRQLELEEQIDKFEWLINNPDVSEHEIQRFLESHTHFLLGVEYKQLHSQLTLVREDRPDLRPDFFLEHLDGGFCDILDLKLPKKKLVVGNPNRRTFSAAVMSAIGQLREYRNYFDDAANRKTFNNAYGLMAYKPRVQVVIGRSNDYQDAYERKSLQEEISHLEILTFDDVLNRVRQQMKLIV